MERESLCECLDRGHDVGDGIHCMCGGVMPRAAEQSLLRADIPRICGEPLGAGYETGVVVCVLPEGHSENHDGGAAEKRLGEGFLADVLESQWEHRND
jgi:hypothetical protein